MTLEHKINTSFIRRIGNAASSALSALSGVGKYVVFAGLSIAALIAYSCGKDAAQSIPEYKDIQQIEDVAQQDIAPDTHPYSKTCLIDKDNDNYGIKENNVFVGWDEECPKGYKILEPPFDCNDKIKSINPGAKELCNNLDDNCNGEIDEGLEMECMTECGPGIMKCIQGQYKNCSAPVKSDEICDCLDNDCDGQIDELPECCVSGESKLQQTCSDGKLKEIGRAHV